MPSKLLPRSPDEPEARFTLRLPTNLYEQVLLLAKQERRSMNTQLVVLIEEALAARDKANSRHT